MSTTERDLAALIPSWLAVTRGREIATGLSREEALERARLLRRLLAERKVLPHKVVLDEDLKDVLHALVTLVTALEPLAAEQLVSEANVVYQFVRQVAWPDDGFEEQRDLLTRCASAGWKELGSSFQEVERQRASADGEVGWDHRGSPNSVHVLAVRSALVRLRRRLLADASLPRVVAEASSLYAQLTADNDWIGLFDERESLIGEAALIAGRASRALGDRGAATRWLILADQFFRAAVAAAPSLARVAYTRLALQLELGELDAVLEALPSIRATFLRFHMDPDAAKCWLLEAMILKRQNRTADAVARLRSALALPVVTSTPTLHARLFCEIADVHLMDGDVETALGFLGRAESLLRDISICMATADLKAFVGGAFEVQGLLDEALDAYRSSFEDYRQMGMRTRATYLRILVAEVLLRMERHRESEAEILQALPTIEEQKMVPEGFAAVALLRESVRRQKTDPEALRLLREHLQRRHGS